jgi:CO/xanthine dehydrogenase Mo-binding subunit
MSASPDRKMTRRTVLQGGAALIVSFSLLRVGAAAAQQPATRVKLPGSLDDEPMLDAWIRIDASGKVTVFTGKAELGQGVKTAVIQVAAEELVLATQAIELVTADTQRTPDEGITSGSHSMQDSATAVMNAAAQVREILLNEAAARWSMARNRLSAANGLVMSDDGKRIGYGELVAGQLLHTQATATSKLTPAGKYRVIGQSLPRVDIPAKVTGGIAYVHDMRLPGMVHARVVRPPSYSARLRDVKVDDVAQMPGVLKTIRDGNYLAVIAEREYQAVMAMYALERAASWDESPTLPEPASLYTQLQQSKAENTTILDLHGPTGGRVREFEASFRRAYQMHAAIGPSCAIGQFQDDKLTVWSHTQGVYPLRAGLAKMLGMPEERIHVIHSEGSGCYGHNGADDVAADASLIARALPGRPVRVQWMREQEHTWEPYGPAMLTKVRAAQDQEGNVVSWQFDVWSNTHSTRPNRAGNLMPSWHLATPQPKPPPRALPQPEGGGDRNAIPLYTFANARVDHHFIPEMWLRVSALRSLGAYMNIFSIESSMDELAALARIDPVEFRLRHLDDARAKEAIRMAADKFGWARRRNGDGHGCGFAFARYKNLAAYAAVAVEVSVDKETRQVKPLRVVAVVDAGQAINPDGIRNQIEGGILQSTSWTLFESVAFDRTRVTSRDWSSYPIMRFSSVPQSVAVHIIDRPGNPFLGTGEAAQGPTAAAIGNAVAAATGQRVRELPIRVTAG